MKVLPVLMLVLGLSLCLLVTRLIWPGSWVGDHFYAYPVTAALFGVVACIWLSILAMTFVAIKKLSKK